jgi:hypothetical protein
MSGPGAHSLSHTNGHAPENHNSIPLDEWYLSSVPLDYNSQPRSLTNEMRDSPFPDAEYPAFYPIGIEVRCAWVRGRDKYLNRGPLGPLGPRCVARAGAGPVLGGDGAGPGALDGGDGPGEVCHSHTLYTFSLRPQQWPEETDLGMWRDSESIAPSQLCHFRVDLVTSESICWLSFSGPGPGRALISRQAREEVDGGRSLQG